jgi:L-fucose isomerase-like protein
MGMQNPRAGFVGFGEVNSPREIIAQKCLEARRALEEANIELVYTDLVSDDPEGRDVLRARNDLLKQDFDLLVLCIAGWIPSHAVISVASEFSHKPILLWGLSGYMQNGKLITTGDQAGTTALRRNMQDMNYRFKFVYKTPSSSPRMDAIQAFARAARAANLLRHSKIGMMGFRDMNLYDTLFDGVSLRAKIGPEVEFFEMLDIIERMERLSEPHITPILQRIRERWVFERPVSDDTLRRGVRFFLAIKQKVEERGYQAISLIDVEGMKKLAAFPPAMVFMLLTDEAGLCTIPENDTLGAVTQLMTRYLTAQVAAYMEIYEFMDDRILFGVPDYVPSEVVDGPVKVTSASFGQIGEGVLNVSKVKTGKLTLCRLASSGDKYTMHMATGQAVEPRKWEEAGWKQPAPQLPSLEVALDVHDFAKKVLSQHYIISYGDNTEAFKDLCELLNIEVL